MDRASHSLPSSYMSELKKVHLLWSKNSWPWARWLESYLVPFTGIRGWHNSEPSRTFRTNKEKKCSKVQNPKPWKENQSNGGGGGRIGGTNWELKFGDKSSPQAELPFLVHAHHHHCRGQSRVPDNLDCTWLFITKSACYVIHQVLKRWGFLNISHSLSPRKFCKRAHEMADK